MMDAVKKWYPHRAQRRRARTGEKRRGSTGLEIFLHAQRLAG
jgi:hypothetical protein